MAEVRLKAIKKNKTIVEKVVDQIQTLIAAGKIKPGDLLPVEYKLAKTFNIGKSTMREALKILEAKGVVEVIPRKGVVVRQQEDPEGDISLKLKISPRYYLDLLEFFRVHVAGLSVLACAKRTDLHLERYAKLLRELEATANRITEKRATRKTYEKYGQLYVAFYTLLGECTCNPVCEEALKSMLVLMLQQGPLGETILTDEPDVVRGTFQFHKDLVGMIEKQDPNKAHTTALKATQRLAEIVSSALSS